MWTLAQTKRLACVAVLALAGWPGAMPVAPATLAGASTVTRTAGRPGGPHASAAPTGSTFSVNTQYDGVYPGACATATAGHCTLREAILEANATTGATINLPGLLAIDGPYRVSIAASGSDDGTTGDLHLTADMSLVGYPGIARSVIIDATGANDRAVYIAPGVTVTISAVTIRHGTAQTGGGIYNDASGTLTLVNSLVSSNTANGSGMSGGGIYNAGTLTLDSSAVSGNTALSGLGGGGIVNDKTGTLTLSHSTVSGNRAGIAGGIRNFGSMHVTGSTVNDNSACCGGGIYNDFEGTLALDTSTVMGNTVTDDGGGINSTGLMTVTNSTVVSNTALIGGGLAASGNLVLTGTSVLSNTATDGGGIENGANLMLIGSTIGDNTAGSNGGGIDNAATLVLTGTTVISNTANAGGGINNAGTLTLDTSTVISNRASAGGGGIDNAGTLMLDTSTVISNSASAGGGGIDNGGALLATNSTLARNTGKYGGAIYSHHAGSLINSTLDGNFSTNASPAGGGIYQDARYLSETLSLASTIVANSLSGGNCSVDPTGFPLGSNGYNLSSDGTCAPYFTQTGDLNGVNPNLGPLADNGGPTLTLRPQFLSPVFDAIPLGTNGCGTTLTTDQRGLPRATDGRCDIGAVEYGGRLSRLWLPLIVR